MTYFGNVEVDLPASTCSAWDEPVSIFVFTRGGYGTRGTHPGTEGKGLTKRTHIYTTL